MSLSFWETVRGVRLADTLIRELPNLTAKRKQDVMTFAKDNELPEKLKSVIREGKSLDHTIDLGKEIVCVFSQES